MDSPRNVSREGGSYLLYDLREQRLRALERARRSIAEMDDILAGLGASHRSRYLVESILRTLHEKEASLVNGLIGEGAVRFKVKV